jgi:hypothetical protein
VGIPQEGVEISIFDVHHYMAGDLSGAMQAS